MALQKALTILAHGRRGEGREEGPAEPGHYYSTQGEQRGPKVGKGKPNHTARILSQGPSLGAWPHTDTLTG